MVSSTKNKSEYTYVLNVAFAVQDYVSSLNSPIRDGLYRVQQTKFSSYHFYFVLVEVVNDTFLLALIHGATIKGFEEYKYKG